MKNKSISILIVNYNTSDFIKLSLYALSILTRNTYHVYICDNGSRNKDREKLEKMKYTYDNITIYSRHQSQEGSVGHAEALDFLLEKVQSTYTVILDADCIFLYNGWDELLIKELKNKVVIAGTPPVSIQKQKPHDFPLMYAVIFITEIYNRLNISMMPDLNNLEKGMDTGYQMREKYLNAGFLGYTLICNSTRVDKSGPFGKTTFCAEYYHPDIESIVACHFGRGSTLGYAKFKSFSYKIPFYGKFIKFIRSRIDKKRWISKCYKIINQQKDFSH